MYYLSVRLNIINARPRGSTHTKTANQGVVVIYGRSATDCHVPLYHKGVGNATCTWGATGGSAVAGRTSAEGVGYQNEDTGPSLGSRGHQRKDPTLSQ